MYVNLYIEIEKRTILCGHKVRYVMYEKNKYPN